MDVGSIQVAGETGNIHFRDLNELKLGVVDLATLLSDTEIEMDISVPAGCINLSGDTKATLSLRFVGVETRAFTVTNIVTNGLIDGKVFDRMTNSVDVIVRGPAEDLEKMTPEDIRIIVDLSKYTYSGTFSIPVTVKVVGFLQVGAVGSYTIAGKIS